MKCQTCGRLLAQEDDPLSIDCGGAALAAGDVLRVEVSAPSALNAHVEISLATGGPPLGRPLQVPAGDRPVSVELGRPPEGVYRVRVLPADKASPVVSDVCCVIAA